MYKTPQLRSTFRSWDDEKVLAVVARSTFPSQNVQSTPCSDHFWKLRYRTVHAVVARSTFPSQNVQNTTCLDHFWRFRCGFWVVGTRDSAPCQKWAKREDFVAFPKTMAGVGHLKWICQDAFSVVGAVQETCSSEMLGGPGANFLRGVAFWASNLQFWEDYFAALRMTWLHFSVAGAIL